MLPLEMPMDGNARVSLDFIFIDENVSKMFLLSSKKLLISQSLPTAGERVRGGRGGGG